MNIAVGLSGGVDSSVAALLLKEQGHHVIGVFMQNWHHTDGTLHGQCEWEDERTIAEMVAQRLGIPFYFVDLSETYRKKVVDYMFAEYAVGRTPNPDILCNREIKFDAFLQYVLDLGVDAVATGHYVRSERLADGRFRLLSGVDPNKDQSYFLSQLSQYQLSKSIFPIGDILKPQVRALAKQAGLPSADKKDSQGICFVGKVDLPIFLQQKLSAIEGPVVDVDSRKVIGTHQGAHFYTIGQRKGLRIGGHVKPLFVIKTDVVENIVYVGEGEDHPELYKQSLFIQSEDIHWIDPNSQMKQGEKRPYLVRIRYRQPLQKATLHRTHQGITIDFKEAQRGITPGQFAVWYDGEEVLGSGTIFA
ncbi:MAG: tRNA 2-thiouridine(34) synthase MnmA [Prevotellaceae bacterium]|jgi:tRNA-specific 2-thiouridylase|nr:tRNA 2-thiouridine(34) synthase MnmA [Prevotellaceae bacterium]